MYIDQLFGGRQICWDALIAAFNLTDSRVSVQLPLEPSVVDITLLDSTWGSRPSIIAPTLQQGWLQSLE